MKPRKSTQINIDAYIHRLSRRCSNNPEESALDDPESCTKSRRDDQLSDSFKKDISVYPAPRTTAEFKKALAAYAGGKGTVQFPLDKPIPYELIARIVAFRAKMNSEAAEGKSQ